MINLENVSIVCVDCLNYNNAKNAFIKSIEHIKFGQYLFLSDKENKDVKTTIIPRINSKEDYSYFMLKMLNDYINTEFCLVIQYDGYIINPNLWQDKFLNFDYIGAPWWYMFNNVGNGGFSLRSKKLLNILQNDYIQQYHPEDAMIGRVYRKYLESNGIRFAPEILAKEFSFEPNVKYKTFKNDSFGFHGITDLILKDL